MTRLIIFEGMDGCGKSTQLNMALRALTSKGYRVINTREPGGTPISEEIRKLLKSNIPMDKSTEAYLFAASRNEHNLQIKKWIEQGYIVLCDRHYLTSYAYQGKDIAVPINIPAMDIISGIKYHFMYFRASYKEYTKRIDERNKHSDRFEDRLKDEDSYYKYQNIYEDVLYHEDVHNNYFDTDNKSIETIHEEVMKELYKIIEEE
jgi:dTMP kinase